MGWHRCRMVITLGATMNNKPSPAPRPQASPTVARAPTPSRRAAGAAAGASISVSSGSSHHRRLHLREQKEQPSPSILLTSSRRRASPQARVLPSSHPRCKGKGFFHSIWILSLMGSSTTALQISYIRPPSAGPAKNYTVLDLNGDYAVVRERWLWSQYDLRLWGFNNSNERYQFGDMFMCSAKTPPNGHFFYYVHYNGKWICLVIDGPTFYLIGFITSSCGPKEELQIWEMFTPSHPVHKIEHSTHMFWQGQYSDTSNINVGGLALVNAFCGMYRYASGHKPRPSAHSVKKWCDTFVAHIPESARLDCLLLCDIYSQFVTGGKAGEPQMNRAQNWSDDTKYAMGRVTETILPSEKNVKKWAWKDGTSKKGRRRILTSANENTNEKRGLSRTVGTGEGKTEPGMMAITVGEKLNQFHTEAGIPQTGKPNKSSHSRHGGTGVTATCKEDSKWSHNIKGQLCRTLDNGKVQSESGMAGTSGDEKLIQIISNVRIFHRLQAISTVVLLSELPIQLYYGQPVADVLEMSEREGIPYLVAPFGNCVHTDCGYINGTWACKVLCSTPSVEKGALSPTCKGDDRKVAISTRYRHQNDCENFPSDKEVKKWSSNNAGDKNARSTSGKEHDDRFSASTHMQKIITEDPSEKDARWGQNAGLKNLGNTCYVNSTLQCLYSVPELTTALLSYSGKGKAEEVDRDSHNLTLASREVQIELNRSLKPVAPEHFLQMLRKRYTQFDENIGGVYQSQDAEELWIHLVQTFAQTLVSESCESSELMMKELFGINLKISIRCEGRSEEITEFESDSSLKCIICEDVNSLDDGILLSMKNMKIEKKISGQTLLCTKESKINELPRYLRIKFVRFDWNRKSSRIERSSKRVEFPTVFNVSKYCSDELRQRLEMNVGSPTTSTAKDAGSIPRKQLNGIYNLICMLTYQGDVQYGHYIAWVKGEQGKWICYNDDLIKELIMKWHIFVYTKARWSKTS